jgi:hypothetical protein
MEREDVVTLGVADESSAPAAMAFRGPAVSVRGSEGASDSARSRMDPQFLKRVL